MHKYLAVMIYGTSHNLHLVSEIFEVAHTRLASAAAAKVFEDMRNNQPDHEKEHVGFENYDELLAGVSLEDKTPLYLAAVIVNFGVREKLFFKLIRGQPLENFIRAEVIADQLASLENTVFTGYYCCPFQL